jgi:hypothetical protein
MPNGRVAFSSEQIIVDQEFVQIASEGRPPEKRFRFGGLCAQGGCQQWTGSRCGVIDTVMETLSNGKDTPVLPDCSIRSQCRWFFQSGADACAVCPEVITDLQVDSAEPLTK